MADRDITGRAAERASKVLLKALGRVHERMPLGPGQVRMTRAELKANMDRMRPDMMAVLMQQLGPERILEMLRDKEGRV